MAGSSYFVSYTHTHKHAQRCARSFLFFVHKHASNIFHIVCYTTMNVGIQISLPSIHFIFFGYIFRGEISRSCSTFIFNFMRNVHIVCFLQWLYQFRPPPTVSKDKFFHPYFSTLVCYCPYVDSYPKKKMRF